MKNSFLRSATFILIIPIVLIAGCASKAANEQVGNETETTEPMGSENTTLTTIPSEQIEIEPLVLLGYYDGMQGNVGETFEANFDGQGGLPPYHFQLDTGTGFPPMGIILDANGKLSGTPTAAGTSTFGVCVVDTAGKSNCGTFTMTVAPAPTTTSSTTTTIPPVVEKISVTSKTCTLKTFTTSSGKSYTQYELTAVGTASGPVGDTITEYWVTSVKCDSWGTLDSTSNTGTTTYCKRRPGDPETTQWTMFQDADHGWSGRTVSVKRPGYSYSASTPEIKCP